MIDNKEIDIEDDDDDGESYFLEHIACTVNIAERVAEANRRHFEEDENEDDSDDRPRKVRFSEQLLDYEPSQPEDFAGDSESVSSNSIDEPINATEIESPITIADDSILGDLKQASESDNVDPCTQEIEEHDDPDNDVITAQEINQKYDSEQKEEGNSCSKILLVLLPREQSSSCESILGEEIEEQRHKNLVIPGNPLKNEDNEIKEKVETKPRPKSARKGTKKAIKKQNCKLSTISPELNCSIENERKSWTENGKLKTNRNSKVLEDTPKPKPDPFPTDPDNLEKKTADKLKRPVSSFEGIRIKQLPQIRPRTAPAKRSCCPIKTDLPNYNGLRSEYGLSAEQLIERRRKISEKRQERKMYKMSIQIQEIQKKEENELKFAEWLETKSSRSRSNSIGGKNSRKIDTLIRSDVFIQKNAAYAKKCGIAYAVNYSSEKNKTSISNVRKKVFSLKKLLDNLSQNDQKTYRVEF